MEFRVGCACGGQVKVSEAKADGEVECPCGRTVRVPSLKEMRLRAGLPAYNISPEMLIEHMATTGQWIYEKYCVGCGKATGEVLRVEVVCERSWQRQPGIASLALVWFAPFLALLAYLSERKWAEGRSYGSDKFYTVPLPVCGGCRARSGGPRELREALRVIPAYEALLDKFPDAEVRLHEA